MSNKKMEGNWDLITLRHNEIKRKDIGTKRVHVMK